MITFRTLSILTVLLTFTFATGVFARDIDFEGGEINVYVIPGEPSQVNLPGAIAGGYRKKLSSLSLEHRGSDLVIFANEGLPDTGEAIIVRLQDGRSFPLRIERASEERQRDDTLRVHDMRSGVISAEEEEPAHIQKKFEFAPPNQISGLMRELVLVAEFGKKSIPGYRVSEGYKGQAVYNDGTLVAVIDKIFIGANLWGYVLDTTNLLNVGQRINPASFRIDGTRAISATRYELAATPLTAEQQLAGAHKTKVYIVAKARK